MSNVAKFCEEIGQITNVVAAARNMIADGNPINLIPLQREVTHMCDTAQTLPPDKAAAVRPAMLSLIEELDRLAETMQAQKDALAEDIRSLAHHSEAARAYRGSSSPGRK